MFTLRLYNHLTMTIQLHELREGDGKLFFHRLVSSTFLPRILEIKYPDFCNHIPDFSSTFSVMAYSLMLGLSWSESFNKIELIKF